MNITTTDWITFGFALAALILSIGLAIFTYRQHNLSLNAGKSALHSYVMSYFVLNSLRTDFEGNKFTVSQEDDKRKIYMDGLKDLSQRMDNLKTENFYFIIYSKYPEIAFLPHFLREEIRYMESDEEYGYNHDVWNKMYQAFMKINGELKHTRTDFEKKNF